MTTRHALVTGASVGGPALAFWLSRIGWDVTVVERAPAFRDGGQNVDVRGPGQEVLEHMDLKSAVQRQTTGEQAWTFVNADNDVVARFDKDDFGEDGPTAQLEILRGDLARILFEASCNAATYRFDDHIVALRQDHDGVDVEFASGRNERFGLVVSAEGAGSSTRALIPGVSVTFVPWDLDMAHFTIPKGSGDGQDARWYNAPGGRSVFLRPDPCGTTRAVLTVQQEPRGWDELPPQQQRQQLVECFADAGWETPRVLEGMQATDDFYFHSIAQVDANRFYSGRCALTGDAAWAVMGTGTTLALVGPYVLAGELARAGDVTTALPAYDRVMREFVEKAHDIPKSGAKFLQPQTRLGIGLQHVALSVVSAPGIRLLTRRFAGSGDNLPPLPRYPELRAV